MQVRVANTKIINCHSVDVYKRQALFSISVAFLGIWFFSATDNSAEGARERELFRAQFIRSQTGFGVEQGRAH